MSDILFTRKLGSNAVSRPQVTNATSAITGTLMNVPSGLLDEGVGSLIKALVISQNPRGLATLETDKGLLTLQTHHPLKAGARLTLQLQSTGAQTRIVILAIDNTALVQSTQDSDPSGGSARAPLSGKGASASTTGSPPLAKETDPTAIRQGGLATAAPNPPAGQPQVLGTAARAHHFASPDPIRTGVVLPGSVISVSEQSVARAAGGPALSPGDNLIVRILELGGSGARADGPSSQQAQKSGLAIKGIVVDVGPPDVATTPRSNQNVPPLPHRQQTVLATPSARIALAASPPGPAGTEVVFEVLDLRPSAPAEGKSMQSEIADFVKLATDWKSIKEVYAIPSGKAETAPAGTTLDAIPRPGATMASSMLFFISALRVGDIGAWLGTKTIERLTEQGHRHLVSQLAADFSIVARHSCEGLSNGWHALTIPVNLGHQLSQVRMYYHRHGRSGDPEQGDFSTRFIVEAELSRFGLFQMDGLIKKARFDLIIRSQSDLSAGIQADIRNIFTEALDLGSMAGTLRFNAGLTAFFSPVDGKLEKNPQGAGVLI